MEGEWPVLPHAPITEALVDVRAELPPETTLETLAELHDSIRDDYPVHEQRFIGRTSFQVRPPNNVQIAASTPVADGHLFRKRDGTQVFQARLDGFTVNRLRPYESWTPLCNEARRLWGLYEGIANPVRITRVALRYINRIELPYPAGNLADWLLTLPQVAPHLPQQLEQYFMRLVLPFEDKGIRAIVSQTIEAPKGSLLPVILDIDAVKDADQIPSSEIWTALERLRDVKNQVFFDSITPQTKAMFL